MKATKPGLGQRTKPDPKPDIEEGSVISELRPQRAPSFPVVGIGASAGGLGAFTQLLKLLPVDTGMAFVLIQHLDPTHTSLLDEALARITPMAVSQAANGTLIEPNHVYVIPANAEIGIAKGRLIVTPRPADGGRAHLPVDSFFRALAEERASHAIGVILSGMASDGTDGLKAIKAENGITFVQQPSSAKYAGMPQSALDAGVVDYCLDIPELAQELIRLSRHPYVSDGHARLAQNDEAMFTQIFALVRDAVGVDFSEYKLATLERRLARRMALRRVEDLNAYLALLQAEPGEVQALYEDILIHVTCFFRDPEVFEVLKAQVFPELLKHKADGAPIRIWAAGCATGEEVYSLAIALLEFLGDRACLHAIQIFGSDVSEHAIEKARTGQYRDSAVRNVNEELRRRYFMKVQGGHRINKNVRDLCVFVCHDLARDPPFSKLDLVSCRNVLIYFEQALQWRVVPTFHYCLNQPGFLLLGRSEHVSGFDQLFSETHKASRLFVRTTLTSMLRFAPRAEIDPTAHGPEASFIEFPRRAVDLVKHLDRMLLARYAPPGVLVNDELEVLQFRGEIGSYLQPAPGEPQNNLIKMARSGLLSSLRSTIAEAKRRMAPVRQAAVEVGQTGDTRTCDVVVLPFAGPPGSNENLFLVMFEEPVVAQPSGAKTAAETARKPATLRESRRVAQLEHELSATKEYLQSLVEEHGQTHDELASTNEELLSGNEELQSINEELETAKEELHSTNEELITVNDQLHSRNLEISQVNSDLVNIFGTVDIPILILDMERRIRRFTPKASSIFKVVASDIGRPIDDIKLSILVPDLDQRIARVIETSTMTESEVQDQAGRWHRMQIRPYKTLENQLDGAVLSFVDIDALKHHIAEAQESRAEAERANRTKDQFLATLSHELRTPLSTMLMQAQQLSGGDLQGDKLKRSCQAIERGTRTIVQLIEDLLDVSRIVTGKLKMEFAPVDLCSMIRLVLEDMTGPAARKALNVHAVLDDSMGPVLGDATRLQQVVTNLLTNAIKFTPNDGHVNVVLEIVDGNARLSVSDTGMGIESKFLPQVFNRFSQEDNTNTRTYGGLGLGLAIVHHLVGLHGGVVQADSPGAGRGATFSVTLPLMTLHRKPEQQDPVELESAQASEHPRVITDPHRFSNLRVLVVDDDRATCDAVAQMLGNRGAEVKIAESAAEAMQTIAHFKPSVILCDIAMPDEDGYSFIRRVRELDPDRGGRIPALALTALAAEEDRQRAIAAGFQMHVGKPVDIDRLTDAVVELTAAVVELSYQSGIPSKGRRGRSPEPSN